MADEKNDSKGSDATKITLALIGLAGTVATGWFGYATVTHKNDNAIETREVARGGGERPADEDRIRERKPEVEETADEDTSDQEPDNAPPPETVNVAGDWITPTGTGGMTFQQQGSNLQASVLVLFNGQWVPFVGTGSVAGRKISWDVATIDNMGISYEYACSGRLSSNNNSIQGKCDGYGGQADVYVNRVQ